MTKNPFSLGNIDVPLCDRKTELEAMARHGENGQNVLLYGSRRTGKTMLVQEAQRRLAHKGFIVVLCDLFGVTSIEDISARICRALFRITHERDRIHRKAIRALTTFRPTMRPTADGMGLSVSVEKTSSEMGVDNLERTLGDLASFVEKTGEDINIVFDEFQEITEVEKGVRIQGVMRKHIQGMPASFFFVGTRKRILSEMFHDRGKPFFQSTFDYELGGLPGEECTAYVTDRFRQGGKPIAQGDAGLVCRLVSGNPYYMQKLCHILFDEVGDRVEGEESVYSAFRQLLESERGFLEATINQLAPKQRSLITALARERTSSIYASEYIKRHSLGSVGGVQQNVHTLTKNDLIAREDGVWRVTDPILEAWLKEGSVLS